MSVDDAIDMARRLLSNLPVYTGNDIRLFNKRTYTRIGVMMWIEEMMDYPLRTPLESLNILIGQFSFLSRKDSNFLYTKDILVELALKLV